jgi:hypothetical protein
VEESKSTNDEQPRPGYEPFAVRRRRRTWLNKVDGRLKRALPKRAYVPMLAAYNGVRSATRRNPGRGRLLPDFVIIGAAKAGTTSLYAWICDHPGVERAGAKEIHYFSFHNYRGTDWYRSHFPFERDRRAFAAEHGRPFLTGEGSPSYLLDPEVPARMAKLIPDVKLIVSLREPVDRAYSQFQMRRRDRDEPVESFLTALALEDPSLDGGDARARFRDSDHLDIGRTYLARSRYAEQLEPWLARFPREQVLVLTTDQLGDDPEGTLDSVYAFLGLPPHRPARLEAVFTSSYESIAPEDRARLAEYFRPHNARLYALLGRDFGWDSAR